MRGDDTMGAPTRRRLATLFVDIAGSTSLLVHHPPEVVLGIVQGFYVVPPAPAQSATFVGSGCSPPS